MSRHPDIEAVLATRKKRKPYKRPRNAPDEISPCSHQECVQTLMSVIEEMEEKLMMFKRVTNGLCRDWELPQAYPDVKIDMTLWPWNKRTATTPESEITAAMEAK